MQDEEGTAESKEDLSAVCGLCKAMRRHIYEVKRDNGANDAPSGSTLQRVYQAALTRGAHCQCDTVRGVTTRPFVSVSFE